MVRFNGAMNKTLTEFLSDGLSAERVKRIHEVASQRTRHLTIVLENITHSHNASACLRTCDCFGVQDVHIVESFSSFKPNPDVARGASKWLTIHRHQGEFEQSENHAPTTERCIKQLKDQGYRILATSPRQNSTPLSEIDITQKNAVIFGSEKPGVSTTAIEHSDELIHVPMFGFTESFNVSVSAAIVLQQLTERLHKSDIKWQLDKEEQQSLIDLWVQKSHGFRLAALCRRFESEAKHK